MSIGPRRGSQRSLLITASMDGMDMNL
jgi:hypothetical protein